MNSRQSPAGKSRFRAGDLLGSGKAIKPRTVIISLYAVLVGVVAGLVAQGLLELVYLFTNLFFSGRWSFKVVYPDQFHLGPWVILIPPIGGFIAGLMIHFWEPSLKGHGTPEAMEAVLIGHSMLRRRVGILKPLATALTIGTGGPFGAEGPIIQTGSVFGSILGQLMRLTPYERRVLLAGGAAAGLAATFIAPLSGILLAIELLLFEFSARSFIPVGLASAAGTAVAVILRGDTPLFGARHWALTHMGELWLFVLLGLLMGLLSVALIEIMFWIENLVDHFPLKPSSIWAPTTGGFIMGVIGYFFPHSLGTSYDTIGAILNDRFHVLKLLEISGAKFWALIFSLGSGTTGGVFAPSLVIGGGFGSAFGALCQHFVPSLSADPSAYALVAMGALFGGVARAPLTSIAFMIELSRNVHALLPLIVACLISDLLCRLLSEDSIMTGKLHKRGLLVFQDYSAPVLIGSHIGDILQPQEPVPASMGLGEAAEMASLADADALAVVNSGGDLTGIIEAHDLLHEQANRNLTVGDVARYDYVLAEPGERVEDVAQKMLFGRVSNTVVVEDMNRLKPLGVVRATDLLRLQRGLRDKHLLAPLLPDKKA
ncbi:MAG: chloride channel protein [Terriglobia bacterium]